ncbi:MAG: hypothetical protein COB79_01760 [Zetaproteobacteria bacterium]|nr:MAG: hypothetical protein COB79_01760 [Zetaproteobacteria bacterium]
MQLKPTHKLYKQIQRLPTNIKSKALILLEKINTGESPFKLGGKRLKCSGNNKHIISTPIGRKYRVLMIKIENTIQPYWIGTHESYNTKITQL